MCSSSGHYTQLRTRDTRGSSPAYPSWNQNGGRLEKGNNETEGPCPVFVLAARNVPTGVTRLEVQNLRLRYGASHRCDRTALRSDCSRGEVMSLQENWVGSDSSRCKESGECLKVKIDSSLKCPCSFNSSTGVLGLQMTAKFVPFCIIVFSTKKVSYISSQRWYFH